MATVVADIEWFVALGGWRQLGQMAVGIDAVATDGKIAVAVNNGEDRLRQTLPAAQPHHEGDEQ